MSRIPVVLSTASAYPQGCQSAFDYANRLGFDGVEVMVWTDPATQDVAKLKRYAAQYNCPVSAIHAPTLLLTQLVWGTDPWVKIERSAQMAVDLGASTVVAHPPFRWQRQYAAAFEDGIGRIAAEYEVQIAVENMFPWRTKGRVVEAYLPGWDPADFEYDHVTLDLSHTATSGSDAMAMARRLGSRLSHIHLADGLGSYKDEHLLPGRGTQPCAELLRYAAASGFTGSVVLEVNTRSVGNPTARFDELAYGLQYARDHLGRKD